MNYLAIEHCIYEDNILYYAPNYYTFLVYKFYYTNTYYTKN